MFLIKSQKTFIDTLQIELTLVWKRGNNETLSIIVLLVEQSLTTVIFIVKSMARVLFYFTFSDARTVVLLGLFQLCFSSLELV